jgi:hypothetical protein
MKIFAIRDEHEPKDLAYLFCYETENRFYIELPDDADPWDTPLILSSVLKRGEKTVNAYWSKVWVQQRIIPSDRQNLGQILKENHMSSYDEYQLLTQTEGRCAQDSYYIAPISPDDLPDSFSKRFVRKVEDVIPLAGKALLVFFRNGTVKRCELEPMLSEKKEFLPLLQNDDYFQKVSIQTGGYGVCWGEQLAIPDSRLYQDGTAVPLTQADLIKFVQQRVVNSAEAAQLLQCSRQNIEDLIRRGKLHPVKESAKSKLFLKSEILQRLWQ